MEYFKNVGKIKYEGKQSDNPLAFKFYNPDEIVAGKTMREQLKFAMSYWHTMCAEGSDMFGVGTITKDYNASTPMDNLDPDARGAFVGLSAIHERGDMIRAIMEGVCCSRW